MTETKPANGLYAALAKVQTDLPDVAKHATADTGSYKYDYADLPTVSAKIMPLLGRNGLAFTSRPTLIAEGKFVLAYSLLHSSGERMDGEYPLPERGTPQQIGSAITYARRYCLCAVTGVAPGGEDDDAAAAMETAMSKPRARGGAVEHERLQPDGTVADRLVSNGPAQRARSKAHDEWTTPAVTDREWYGAVEAEIKKFTTDEYGEVLRRRVVEKTEAGGCTKDDAEKLRTLIRARRQALAVEAEAPAEAEPEAGETADA